MPNDIWQWKPWKSSTTYPFQRTKRPFYMRVIFRLLRVGSYSVYHPNITPKISDRLPHFLYLRIGCLLNSTRETRHNRAFELRYCCSWDQVAVLQADEYLDVPTLAKLSAEGG